VAGNEGEVLAVREALLDFLLALDRRQVIIFAAVK